MSDLGVTKSGAAAQQNEQSHDRPLNRDTHTYKLHATQQSIHEEDEDTIIYIVRQNRLRLRRKVMSISFFIPNVLHTSPLGFRVIDYINIIFAFLASKKIFLSPEKTLINLPKYH